MVPSFSSQSALLLSVPSPSVAETNSIPAGTTSVIKMSLASADVSPSLVAVMVYVTRSFVETLLEVVVLVTTTLEGLELEELLDEEVVDEEELLLEDVVEEELLLEDVVEDDELELVVLEEDEDELPSVHSATVPVVDSQSLFVSPFTHWSMF